MSPLVPQERREWAEAMAAEVEGIESGWGAWRWALGSALTLIRVAFAAAVRNEWQRGVTMSRVVVVACVLLVAVLLFATPVVRQGLSLVGESWSVGLSAPLNGATQRDVERVRADHRSQNDPQALAYLALNETDTRQADFLVTEAVGRDPKLGWVYAKLAVAHPGDRLAPAWVERFQEYAGNNALAPLLAAREIRLRTQRAQGKEITPEWEAQMKAAFAAPEYNDYMRERLDLQRVIMRRYEVGSPISLLAVIFRFNPANDIHLYADKLILEGNRSGDLSKYRAIIAFAQRLYLGASTDLEQNMAKQLLGRTMAILGPKLMAQGHAGEAAQMSFQAAAIQRDTKNAIENGRGELLSRSVSVIHLATLFGLISLTGIAGTSVAWMVGRLRRKSYRGLQGMMSGFSMVLASSLATLYVSYRPYEEMYRWFVDGGYVPPKVLSALAPIVNVPFYLFHNTPSFSANVLLWQMVFVAGMLALVGIVLRHLPGWRKSHAS